MSDLLETLRLAADDPMWADHAEVPKKLLRHTVDRIEALEREVKELRADIETFWKPQFDEQVERAEAAEAERDEARISLGEAEHHLSNLLARIHRDGGHYEADHGAVKAAEDADKIVANLQAAEALSGSNSGWRVPDGWKLVPVELTSKMCTAGYDAVEHEIGMVEVAVAYRAMLAASPAAPQQGGE